MAKVTRPVGSPVDVVVEEEEEAAKSEACNSLSANQKSASLVDTEMESSSRSVDERTLIKVVSDFPEEQLLVAVFPGVPTAAELFLLPNKNQSEGKKKSEEELEQASGVIVSALNQNLVEFELKPGVRVIVYNTQLTLAPLVDSIPRHSSSAMLMLLSVVFLGLAVFLIYKFKRKIPWINIYAEVNQEKEQEMIGSVGQGDSTPKITLSEFTTSKELMEKELDARVKRGVGNACESTREIPNCTSV